MDQLDDETVELREWDAVRVPPGMWRGYEAGPDGLEIIVIGAPSLGEIGVLTSTDSRRLRKPSDRPSALLLATQYRHDMATRRASCSCGQLTVEVEGDPVRISICHCLACQRRTGSVFGMQARWPREQVRIEGDATEYVRISDEGKERSLFFCPRCGATVYYRPDPEHIAVPVGAFADPNFPAPRVSVWEDRMHPWVRLPDGIEHRLSISGSCRHERRRSGSSDAMPDCTLWSRVGRFGDDPRMGRAGFEHPC